MPRQTTNHRRPGRPRRNSHAPSALEPRDEILHHASAIFSAKGVGATTVTDIANAVGLTQAAIYYHFAGRDDILAALIDYVIEETDAFSAAADQQATPAERLRFLISRHVYRLTTSPYDLWFIAGLSEAEARNHDGLVEHHKTWQQALSAIVTDGQRQGHFIDIEPRLAVASFSGLVYSALQQHHVGTDVDPEVIANLAVRSLSVEPVSH